MTWEYFTADEMRCSHTGECAMDPGFMAKLDALRADYGAPMAISSAYRHPTHPVEARKSAPGAHATGKAADVLVSGKAAHKLLRCAMRHGFTGIGISQKGKHARRFIHLDMLTPDEGFRPTVWTY